MRHRLPVVFALLVPIAGGCAATSKPLEIRMAAAANLARVGLEVVGDEEAGVPSADRARVIPCRVIAGFAQPPVPEHEAGYLITSVGRLGGMARRDLEVAIAGWKEGQKLILTIRRNPYFAQEADWYEVNVPLTLR